MYVKVKAFPDAGKETVQKINNDTFRITVKEPARAGAANKRLIDIIAYELKVEPNRVRLVKGHTAASKIFEILQ